MGARIAAWLKRSSPAAFSTYAIVAAFSAYFSMYAFRKPFAAAEFAGQAAFGIELKNLLIFCQVVGYALAKFLGIKFVSETRPGRRAVALVVLIGAAEAALLAFAVLPPEGQLAALFLNGLALGAVWGLVFGFLEGRQTSEILGAGLSASYIVASGAVKSVGAWLMQLGVTQAWMPFTTGLLFLAPFWLAVWMLRQLPPPSADDARARTTRAPMRGRERVAFVGRFAFGLVALTGLYMFLTAYRDFRDNFAAEIWAGLGWADKPAIFTYSEIPVAFAVMLGLALIYRIRANRAAFFAVHGLMAAGTLLIGCATALFDLGLLDGAVWMVLLGIGLYLGYVPYGCVLFDRLIATTGAVGTAVFMIYVTDAFGYLGSLVVLAIKTFSDPNITWIAFFRGFSYVTAVVCTAAFAMSSWYFSSRTRAAR